MVAWGWGWKQKGKIQKQSPFEGVEGVERKREENKFLWRVPNLVHLFGDLAQMPYLCRKNKIMAVLNFTSREFRSQQAHVFDLADQGERVIIRRSRKQAYTLVPIEDDDLTITPELQERIDRARTEIKAGKCVSVYGKEELNAYLESL